MLDVGRGLTSDLSKLWQGKNHVKTYVRLYCCTASLCDINCFLARLLVCLLACKRAWLAWLLARCFLRLWKLTHVSCHSFLVCLLFFVFSPSLSTASRIGVRLVVALAGLFENLFENLNCEQPQMCLAVMARAPLAVGRLRKSLLRTAFLLALTEDSSGTGV